MADQVLDELEARVREAVERLGSLKEQNARLAERVSDLEEQLTAAETAVAGAPDAGASSAGRAAWAKEREEIRRRLEGLTSTLADLLEG